MEGEFEGELEEDEQLLVHKQRLKAAMHYAVGRVCEEVEGASFSKEVMVAITETAFKQCEVLAIDLEHFAKHAHRTTVNGDDVKLCCRRSPSLLEHITAQSTKLRAAREAEAARKKSGKRGGKGAGPPPTAAEEDDDDDG